MYQQTAYREEHSQDDQTTVYRSGSKIIKNMKEELGIVRRRNQRLKRE